MTVISPQLGVSPSATTGGETYDRELLKQLGELGIEVDILLPQKSPIPVTVKNWHVERAPIVHFVPPYTFNFFSIPWVFQKVGPRHGVDRPYHTHNIVLRIHSPEYLFPTAYVVRKLYPGIPIVAHYHLDQTGWMWTKMNRFLLNTVDAVVADSEFLKKKLVERVEVNEEKIHVIYCGVDIHAIRPKSFKGRSLSTQGPSVRGGKTILFLGRFIERKHPDMAIEIFARLHRKYLNTKLVMIGEGPLEKELRAKSEELRVHEAVEFPGPLFGEEKLRRYHEADLFLFPSAKEGFVLVVLEAMAAGLPMLVPNAMGFPEAVEDGKNGFLADSTSINDWVQKAQKILFSPSLQHQFRKRSREIAVTKFSWEQCAKKNFEVYRQLMKTS